MIKKLILVVTYLVCWWVTWGGMLAQMEVDFEGFKTKRGCRQDMVFFMGISAIPVVPWVLFPFMTGFYQDGFRWTCRDMPVVDSFGKR